MRTHTVKAGFAVHRTVYRRRSVPMRIVDRLKKLGGYAVFMIRKLFRALSDRLDRFRGRIGERLRLKEHKSNQTKI